MSEPVTTRPLTPTEFVPLGPGGHRSQFRLSFAWIALGILGLVGAVLLLFLVVARAVIFRVEPAGIAFALGNRAEFAEDLADDLDRLQAFVDRHGREHIFELSTF